MSDTKRKEAAGKFVEIECAKLGPDGFKMIGELDALGRWISAFDRMRNGSAIAQERIFLGEVIAALAADAERVKLAFVQYATRVGAAKVHVDTVNGKASVHLTAPGRTAGSGGGSAGDALVEAQGTGAADDGQG